MEEVVGTAQVIVGAQHTFAAAEVIPAGYWAVVSPTFGVKIPPSNNVIKYVAGEWILSDGTWTSASAGQIAAPLAAGQPPPIQIAPNPPSTPGVQQPIFATGSPTSPAPPIAITGSPLLPPPLIGSGGSVPQAVSPAAVPPSVPGYTQPQFKTGSATSPTAASFFPSFSVVLLNPPLSIDNNLMIGVAPPQVVNPHAPMLVMNGWYNGSTGPTPGP